MAQTTVSVRMDDALKRDFDSVCNDLGLSMDPFYSEENMARLRKSIAQMEATGGTVHEVDLRDN